MVLTELGAKSFLSHLKWRTTAESPENVVHVTLHRHEKSLSWFPVHERLNTGSTRERWKRGRTIEVLPTERVQKPDDEATLVYEDDDNDIGPDMMAWPRR